MHESILETAASDGYRLRYRSWQSGASDTLVVLQHGVLTHSAWFGELGDDLLERGLHVLGHDRRGSGLNTEARGDATGPRQLLDDLHALVEPQRPRYRRIVHLGWCLGATVALRYLLERPAMGDGLILMSPDIFERHLSDSVRRVFSDPQWDDRVLPRLKIPIPAEIYTDTPYLDSFIRPDPLKLYDFTPRLLRASLRLKTDLEEHFQAFRKPSLLVLAGRDQIIDNDRTRELYARIGSPSPRVLVLDTHHGIQFEALAALAEAVEVFATGRAVGEEAA